VTLNGKPLPGAVVTFLPLDEHGTPTVSDTDEEGRYALTYQTFAGGTAPGSYRVAVSYLVTTSGKPVDLSTRSALSLPKEVIEAKELLPRKYSDLGRSELGVTVPLQGGTFDFPLEAAGLEIPTPSPDPAPAEPEAPSSETKPTPAAEKTPSEVSKPNAEETSSSSVEAPSESDS
jgi:hypothetical protein